jgi:hypothetical protein
MRASAVGRIHSDRKSVNLKYALVLTGMLSFKRDIQSVERYCSVVNCALNVEDPISNNSFKLIK